MKKFASILAVAALATSAFAANYTATCGWEDGGTILGNYGSITATNVSSPVHSGSKSLKLVDGGASGTPQAYVAWVEGIQPGDTISASFWVYDTTPGASPSARIWGHYNDNNDINDYAGSADGNGSYGDGNGWSQLSHTWTFQAGSPGYDPRTGFVLEARTYSSAGDTVWIDDLQITVDTDVTEGFIQTPCGTVAIPEPASISLLGLAVLGLIRRR